MALSALQSLVFEVQKTLKDEPATRGMRRVLLDRAIAGLRELAKGSDDATPDLSILAAHHQMGSIFDQLGETVDARRQYETCLPLAADLIGRGGGPGFL
jgi:eukaryotic-like serine/threonine-protein kinase